MLEKTRVRDSGPRIYPYSVWKHTTGTGVYKQESQSDLILLPAKEELFTEDVGSSYFNTFNQGKKKRVNTFKNCYHSKITRTSDITDFVYHTGPAHDRTITYFKNARADESILSKMSWIPPEFPDSFIDEAYRNMRPSFKSDFSIANFIYELREIGSIFPMAKGIVDRLKSGMLFFEQHLNVSFGINPIISDLETFAKAMDNFLDKYDRFQKAQGRLQTSHYKKEILPEDSREVVPLSGLLYEYCHNTYTCIYTATMRYRYVITGDAPDLTATNYTSLVRQTKLILKYLGLRDGNISASLWNAMPFSFVIDWVSNAGDILRSLDKGAIDISLEVSEFLVSQTVRQATTFRCYPDPTYPPGSSSTFWTGNETEKTRREIYQRKLIPEMRGNPQLRPELPVLEEFTGREQMLAVSLGAVLGHSKFSRAD
jgi:hypothetical protein